MSNAPQQATMTRDAPLPSSKHAFGTVDPQQRLLGLDKLADRDRGFLTKSDRRYLTRRNLSGQSERRGRMRIRNRTLRAYLDARYLRELSDGDRNQIFSEARDDEHLEFRDAVKEWVRFTHRGLLEFNVDTLALIEEGIKQAEQARAREVGEVIDVDVDIRITRESGPEITELQERFDDHKKLSRPELAALVNNPHTNIGLVDAIEYEARQPFSSPKPAEYKLGSADPLQHYGEGTPDVEKAEESVSQLRALFEDHEIENYEDYEAAYERWKVVDEAPGEELLAAIDRLARHAPQFAEQLAADTALATRDIELLHHLIWLPEQEDVKAALKENARPPTAGRDWDPAEDDHLQKFIARIQVSNETHAPALSMGEEARRRWEEVLELAQFDEEEWSEYMHDLRLQRVKDSILSFFEAADGVSADDLPRLLEDADNLLDSEVEPQQPSDDSGELARLKAFYSVLPDSEDTETGTLNYARHMFGPGLVLEALEVLAERNGGIPE